MTANHRNTDIHALEALWAARLVKDLNEHAEGLPRDVKERLRFARAQALTRTRLLRASRSSMPVAVSGPGTLVLGSFVPWLQRTAWLLLLLLLLGGLVVIQQWSTRESMLAAAEIDTLLLADTLPPSAYGDPGFAEFLRTAPQQ